VSRNQREGRYAGKLYGNHWRSRYFRRPGDYVAELAPYMAIVRYRPAQESGEQKGGEA
jgi:hypothetical protein